MSSPDTRWKIVTPIAVVLLLSAILGAQDTEPAAKPPVKERAEEWPRRTTMDELRAMFERGDYHLIRKEKIAHRIVFEAKVDSIGKDGLARVSSQGMGATLHNLLTNEHPSPIEKGDRLQIDALIVGEFYAHLQLWVMRCERR